ncbi:hypothetical protein ACFLS9_07745 [Bacteroidota bacterium]
MLNKDKHIVIRVDEEMCRKVHPRVKEGDDVIVSSDPADQPKFDHLCLISENDVQWLEIFWWGLRGKHKNIYPVIRVVCNT